MAVAQHIAFYSAYKLTVLEARLGYLDYQASSGFFNAFKTLQLERLSLAMISKPSRQLSKLTLSFSSLQFEKLGSSAADMSSIGKPAL